MLGRNKLYSIMGIACIAGYIWLYAASAIPQSKTKVFTFCPVKEITHIPCPACGSTRSVIALGKGNFKEALLINPLGYVVAFIMLLGPAWIGFDLITKRKTFFEFYQKTESKLKKPGYALPLILLLLMNWIWNITKGL
jgi:hypothetical protein